MANVMIEETTMISIANAIRTKTGKTAKMLPSVMSNEILTITEGEQQAPLMQAKTATPSKSQQVIIPDVGYDGLSQVSVEAIPDEYIIPAGNKQISENGTVDVTEYEFAEVNVPDNPPVLQQKSVTPSEITQTVSQDSGYDGLSSVTVNAISSTYVGSSITQRPATTYTPGTSDQMIESGIYLSGDQTIKGDANLIPDNIKNGVPIFNVTGAYIPESGGIDTSDATAVAGSILSGETAYVNGEKITGTLPTTKSGSQSNYYNADGQSVITKDVAIFNNDNFKSLRYVYEFESDRAFLTGSKIGLRLPLTEFGDAVASDVVSGKKFTSADGVNIVGTHEDLDTSDATATAEDIASGKTAYVNGEKITGNITTIIGKAFTSDDIGWYEGTVVGLRFKASVTDRTLFKENSSITIVTPQSNLGDATAEDVAVGKTFTSASGLKVVGTAEASSSASNDNNEAYHITDASTVLSFKRTDGTIKVWGYGAVKGSYTTTVYSFVGDGYYSGSYSTPTKTTVEFGLNADGTLNGLPSGLTALDILITKGI